MIIRRATVLALAVMMTLVGGNDVAAQGQGRAGGGGRGGPPMTPVVYRQQIMQQLQQSTGALTAIRNGTVGTASHLVPRALIVQQLAMMVPDAFAANPTGETSRSLPAIWENAADFASKAQALRTAADALLEAARGGNAEAVGTAQTAVGQTCQGCHMAYRGPAAGA
ncbi:MAG: cytochrome c [Longimicrobiales bacterium]